MPPFSLIYHITDVTCSKVPTQLDNVLTKSFGNYNTQNVEQTCMQPTQNFETITVFLNFQVRFHKEDNISLLLKNFFLGILKATLPLDMEEIKNIWVTHNLRNISLLLIHEIVKVCGAKQIGLEPLNP